MWKLPKATSAHPICTELFCILILIPPAELCSLTVSSHTACSKRSAEINPFSERFPHKKTRETFRGKICFPICLSELVRETAESPTLVLIQGLFARYFIFSSRVLIAPTSPAWLSNLSTNRHDRSVGPSCRRQGVLHTPSLAQLPYPPSRSTLDLRGHTSLLQSATK